VTPPEQSIDGKPTPGGSLIRSEYLIGSFRVLFESGGGWNCVCPAFLKTNRCRHCSEAMGMRAAQAQILKRIATGRSLLAPRAASFEQAQGGVLRAPASHGLGSRRRTPQSR
jgi:hypothetical protein